MKTKKRSQLQRAAGVAALLIVGVAGPAAAAPVSVDPSGRHLVNGEGKPFFWLGDTAWLLTQTTDRREAELYLRTRARQRFTVVQAALVMAEERVAGTLRPNRYGDRPFVDGDAGRPAVTPGANPEEGAAYDYWDHVDFIVETARKQGLVMAVLPLFVGSRGDGYEFLTPKNAFAYGRFLGERYRAADLVWVLGGDHVPRTDEHKAVWDLMAKGITEATAGKEDYARTTMTYHIGGVHSSSEHFQDRPWLDFNMIQTWGSQTAIHRMVLEDRERKPIKPSGVGEGSYEDGPQYPTGPIDALMIRKQAYWSYLAGGYHTYGNTNVWNFGTFKPEGTGDWKSSLWSPGAKSLSLLRGVFDSLPWWNMEPDRGLLVRRGQVGSSNPNHVALRARDGTGAVIYVSLWDKIAVDVRRATSADKPSATWIDPRTGARRPTDPIRASGEQTFVTPAGWQDAVLVIDGGLGRLDEPMPSARAARRPPRRGR